MHSPIPISKDKRQDGAGESGGYLSTSHRGTELPFAAMRLVRDGEVPFIRYATGLSSVYGTSIWALRVRIRMEGRVRELALFNLGIDSKLARATSLPLRSATCATVNRLPRAPSLCSKTQRPVQLEITAATREVLPA